MKRNLMAFVMVWLLLLSLSTGVCASEAPALVVDNAGLLTTAEADSLESMAQALRLEYEMDIVILTVNSLDGKQPQAYADDYFDWNGYGCGDDYSGALFLLSMEERDWYISTHGNAIYALTDYGIQDSTEAALSYFAGDDYYNGFYVWLSVLPAYLDAWESGAPVDGQADDSADYYHADREEILYYEEDVTPSIFLSLLIGMAAAGITVLVMRLGMNTKRPQHSAASYLTEGSYRLRTQQDIFLYSNVTKRARPQEQSSGSRGGSSVHRSSSGRRHGGGGGKF